MIDICKYLLVLLILSTINILIGQPIILENFESIQSWKTIASNGVEIEMQSVKGKEGDAIQIDFNFVTGPGYCGIEKVKSLELPDNFKFTFWIKADAPANNLEFKLLDESGENVWWYNQRNYEFPKTWTKITIKKRDIQFAWGSIEDKTLNSINKIELFIASTTGGKGTVLIDELSFEELEVSDTTDPEPLATASSFKNGFPANNIFDNNPNTEWQNSENDTQPEITIDLQKHFEYGGVVINWDEKSYAIKYDIYSSYDKISWENIYSVKQGKGGKAYIPLKNSESCFLKLKLLQSANNSKFAIKEIEIKNFEFSQKPENIFKEMAKDNPAGYFPRYLSDEQTYWTITGVNNDFDEALINEDGMVEVDKSRFSIEPFIYLKNKLYTYRDVTRSQKLEQEYLPVPSVNCQTTDFDLNTNIFADGPAGKSVLYLMYNLKNTSNKDLSGNLYLALRPFQVNPPWQFLNWPGGIAKIDSIKFEDGIVQVNNDKSIYPLTTFDNFATVEFDEGEIVFHLAQDKLPSRNSVHDHTGYASAAFKYEFQIKPHESKRVVLAVPFHVSHEFIVHEKSIESRLQSVFDFWKNKLNIVKFNLPKSADRLVNTIRSNLAYILINRDGFGIQPGSRSYERSWIRDGSMTSSALLKFGIHDEVRDFINWYAGYQFPNGKVPCVVDRRGPDPVPENDSYGELIFSLMQYFQFTKDTTFLTAQFDKVQKAIKYMDYLRSQRQTEKYENGDEIEKACYGLLPESISHEGYSAKPMHSYWDDFWGIKGYKDAVGIAQILNKQSISDSISESRDQFVTDFYHSLNQAVKIHDIDYIPGCVELGDFDATSTAIAIYPVNELNRLPPSLTKNTFDRYYKFFENRKKDKIEWRDFTPYEVRLVGTFVYIGETERAHDLIDFFFNYQYPKAWNQWAEVVRKGKCTPGFIGDMPHTWVGSDFINAARSMFVYENEFEKSLIIGVGLYDDWINAEGGMAVKNMPTYYGILNYSIKSLDQNRYEVNLYGKIDLPDGNIKIRNLKQTNPKQLLINGKEKGNYKNNYILVDEFPAKVEIRY